MISAILWLMALSAMIAIARLMARRRCQTLTSFETGRLNERYAGRYAAFVTAAAVAFAALIAIVASNGGRLWPLWSILAGGLVGAFAVWRIKAQFHARKAFETAAVAVMAVIAGVAVITTFGIFLTLIVESVLFFNKVPIQDFLFGRAWSPQTAIRADQVASEGAFGVLPLITGTLLVTGIALLVAAPIGLMAAIYLETYAGRRMRDALKLVLELLAGVPTVVYGFFALLIIGPAVSNFATALGASFGLTLDVPAQNALAAGLVMGVMIIPFVSSLSHDVMSAIPPTLREGSYALGATKSETILKVILPAAAPGLVGAFLLAVSRAIGETMIVVMAASRSANLTFNPLERVTTMTVQIVALLTGDQEFDSAKTLAAFALGLLLFLITLALNVVALLTVKQFRMRYE